MEAAQVKGSRYRIAAINETEARIDIAGEVVPSGWEWWFGDDTPIITYDSLVATIEPFLEQGIKKLHLRIDSGGGDVQEGLKIYNYLQAAKKSRGLHITTSVIGIAASMAAVLFMAGDVRDLPFGTRLMLHDVSYSYYGKVEEHRNALLLAQSYRDDLIQILTSKIGDKEAAQTVEGLMQNNQDNWISPEKAVKLGLATDSSEALRLAAAKENFYSYQKKQAMSEFQKKIDNFFSKLEKLLGGEKPSNEQPTTQEAQQPTAEPQPDAAAALLDLQSKYDALKAENEALNHQMEKLLGGVDSLTNKVVELIAAGGAANLQRDLVLTEEATKENPYNQLGAI